MEGEQAGKFMYMPAVLHSPQKNTAPQYSDPDLSLMSATQLYACSYI